MSTSQSSILVINKAIGHRVAQAENTFGSPK